jgi:hypothetical protein
VLTQLHTGAIHVGLVEKTDWDVDHAKIGVKRAETAVIKQAAFIGRQKPIRQVAFRGIMRGVDIVNMLIALLVQQPPTHGFPPDSGGFVSLPPESAARCAHPPESGGNA